MRRDRILKHVSTAMRGIEIGPYFAPLAPKARGYDCLSLDVFDQATLRERAKADANVPDALIPDIEPVDMLGSSTEIEALVAARGELGSFDYVISSHNFEHLPNPIKFLQGCARVLKPGGIVSLAIPDKRATFDYFRPLSSTGQMIEAFVEDRRRPTEAQIFDHEALEARLDGAGQTLLGFTLADDPARLRLAGDLIGAHEAWRRRLDSGDTRYIDAHCWVFTPASFELALGDLIRLGLVPFQIVEVTGNHAHEFYAHLRHAPDRAPEPVAAFEARRVALLRRIPDELAVNAPARHADRRWGLSAVAGLPTRGLRWLRRRARLRIRLAQLKNALGARS